MLKDNSTVTIGNKTYQFRNRIGKEPLLLRDFNALAKKTFGIEFESVGGEYEPHVLTIDNMVCANVSVNQIPFYDHGERKCYIQLGTVMTRKEYRKNGLGRWLLENIINEWKDKCDAIYLFGNDSVLEYYPKFGFKEEKQYEYRWQIDYKQDDNCQKLDMSDSKNVQLVFEKYKEENVFSDLCMIQNQAIFDFYATGICKNNIYYLEKQNVIAFVEYEAGKVYCHDVFGKTDAKLEEILGVLKKEAHDEVILGFTPKETNSFLCLEHKEEDTTLFINDCGKDELKVAKRMFPVISHA